MAAQYCSLSLLSFLAFFLFAFGPYTASLGVHAVSASDAADKIDGAGDLDAYIIRVRVPENTTFAAPQDLENWYKSFLPPTLANATASRYMYSYTEAMTGFAARLTEEELEYVKMKDGFLAAYPDEIVPLLTTHTPSFLGLQLKDGPWNKSNMGKGIIIGLLDTGIRPGHPSFNDENMDEPPPKWKGVCRFKDASGCNKKVIGAQVLLSRPISEAASPDDEVGHGTHTASTAAGNFVDRANVLGSANGTASGIAPRAHLAMYKVCASFGCSAADVTAGIDTAIKDGVDVLSISLGGGSYPFYDDVIAIGAFSAMKKGIFVSCAGGNSGPFNGTLSNEAPWVLTVGATTMDRNLRATVKLGDGQEFNGESAYQPEDFSSSVMHQLVCPAGGMQGNCDSGQYLSGVKGKVVVCQQGYNSRIDTGRTVLAAGGLAMILINSKERGYTTLAEAHVLPASHLNYVDGQKVVDYVNKSSDATATIIFKGTVLGVSPSPTVGSFSSRGPSMSSPRVLKPDVTGPGVNVLAAWPFQVGPPKRQKPSEVSRSTFNVISGTSMSTPHLSGIAALVKLAHPDWSSAAIKSAIMTTSDIFDRRGKPVLDEQHQVASFFSMGAGHVNPFNAIDPGLVYDLTKEDYVAYLCAINYTDAQVETVAQEKYSCKEMHRSIEDFNYPAMGLDANAQSATFTRTVTNVGPAKSRYVAMIQQIKGEFTTEVTPETLEFSAVNEKKSYTVTVTWKSGQQHVEGNLWLISNEHIVRTPIILC